MVAVVVLSTDVSAGDHDADLRTPDPSGVLANASTHGAVVDLANVEDPYRYASAHELSLFRRPMGGRHGSHAMRSRDEVMPRGSLLASLQGERRKA